MFFVAGLCDDSSYTVLLEDSSSFMDSSIVFFAVVFLQCLRADTSLMTGDLFYCYIKFNAVFHAWLMAIIICFSS